MTPFYKDKYAEIYHGDAREILPVVGPFDMLLTDPPYGTETLTGGYGRAQNHGGGRKIQGDACLTSYTDVMDLVSKLIIRPAWILAFCAPRRMPEAVYTARALGFEWFGEIVWDKATPGLGYTIRYQHESCMVFKLGEPEKPERAPLSVVRYPVSHVNTQDRHPHEKPVDFWQNALWLPGKRVVDPFMGSGTTLRAAKNLNRKAIGIEIEERYCEIAAKRMAQEVLAL